MQKAACDRYFAGPFVKFMMYNEKALIEGGGMWFVGGKVCILLLCALSLLEHLKMSWADLTIAEFLQRLDEFRPGCIDAYPKCKALVKRVHELPNIAKYVAQRPKTPF